MKNRILLLILAAILHNTTFAAQTIGHVVTLKNTKDSLSEVQNIFSPQYLHCPVLSNVTTFSWLTNLYNFQDLTDQVQILIKNNPHSKIILCAAEEDVPLALHYVDKHPTHISALFLKNSKFSDSYPISELKEISIEIPVIMVHKHGNHVSTREEQEAFGAKLKNNRPNAKIYFIPTKEESEKEKTEERMILIINTILDENGLPNNASSHYSSIHPSEIKKRWQPEPTPSILNGLKNREDKERTQRYIGWACKTGCVGLLLCLLHRIGILEKINIFQS